jgi:hypothetical protein
MFPDSLPLFLEVGIKYGYEQILDGLLEKSFAKGEEIKDLRIVQGILLVASMRCETNYCTTFHSLIMNTLGVTAEDIKFISANQEFPLAWKEEQKYNELLKMTFYRKSILVDDDYSFFSKVKFNNSVPAIRDYIAILMLADMLTMLTVVFEDEINLKKEKFFTTFPTYDLVGDYIKYFSKVKNEFGDITNVPNFTLCMKCKDLKNQETNEYSPIERVINKLPRNARFSHGVCPTCSVEVKASYLTKS